MAIISFLLLSSCTKKPARDCFYNSTATVKEVNGENTLEVNQEASFTISYYLNNGCGHFEKMESSSKDNVKTISLLATYSGCACPEMLINGEVTYIFKATEPGIYYLKFIQPDLTYLTETITVN